MSKSEILQGSENSIHLEVNHEGIEIPIVVKFYYEPEEKPTSDCPGSEEDFEITEIAFDEDFDAQNFMDENFNMNVLDMASWFECLEKSIIKAFHDKIEKDKDDEGWM